MISKKGPRKQVNTEKRTKIWRCVNDEFVASVVDIGEEPKYMYSKIPKFLEKIRQDEKPYQGQKENYKWKKGFLKSWDTVHLY